MFNLPLLLSALPVLMPTASELPAGVQRDCFSCKIWEIRGPSPGRGLIISMSIPERVWMKERKGRGVCKFRQRFLHDSQAAAL